VQGVRVSVKSVFGVEKPSRRSQEPAGILNTNRDSQTTTGIHQISRNLKCCTKGRGEGPLLTTKRGRGEQREDLLTEGGKERWQGCRSPVGDGGRRRRKFAGGGEENRQRTESAGEEEEIEPGHGLGQRGIFLKTEYGRTGQSTVPVRCTPDSAQENWILARGCRCTGHCTVQCPVHTGLSGEPRQRRF
jgi:hypothetical protein